MAWPPCMGSAPGLRFPLRRMGGRAACRRWRRGSRLSCDHPCDPVELDVEGAQLLGALRDGAADGLCVLRDGRQGRQESVQVASPVLETQAALKGKGPNSLACVRIEEVHHLVDVDRS